MSKLETNTIDTVSGTTTLTIGSTNTSTIDFSNPANVTLNAAMKNQHLFFASDCSGISMGNSSNTKMIYGTELFDLSSAYNPTNGRFTAPEAGYYFFFANWRAPILTGIESRCDVSFYKNGTAFGAIGGLSQHTGRDYGTYGTAVLNLVANDYIEVYGNQNGGTTITTSNSNNAGTGTIGGTGFMGYKIIT